jgi:hypothetical protein
MRRAFVWQMVFLALLLAGCSRSPTRRVVGEISYNGEPIQQGAIEFIPIEGTGGPSVGAPIKDGAYDVPAAKGPLASGTYRVELRAVRNTGQFPPGPRHPNSIPIMEHIIPAEYHIHSKLQVKIDPDSNPNRFDFHLPK